VKIYSYVMLKDSCIEMKIYSYVMLKDSCIETHAPFIVRKGSILYKNPV
jgi:hypothetical protein